MLYVSSACIKNKDRIAEVIRQLAEEGIKNIELSGGTVYYNGIERDLQMLKAKYDLSYAFHAYFPPPKIPFVVNLASCNDQIYQKSINHYIQCIELMNSLECKVLSIHAGFQVEIDASQIGHKLNRKNVYDRDNAYDRFCSAYEYIEKCCAANSIKLFLENNVLNVENYRTFGFQNYMMLTDYASIMEMKKRLNFNLLLDLGHLYVSSNTLGLNYSQECNKLKEHVKWIHISENNGLIDEHKPLKSKSMIMREFYNIYNPLIDVTLEASGGIQEILEGLEKIELGGIALWEK